LILKSPKSFKYKFSKLAGQYSDYNPWSISIIYSDDSLLRIFNWLPPATGTWHYYPAVFQAKNKNNKIICDESPIETSYAEGDHPSTDYDNIYKIKSKLKQLYLCIGRGQGSYALPFEVIETYEVIGDSIKVSNILPDSGKMTSTIYIDRRAISYKNKSQDVPSSKYDKKNQVLKIPEIIGNDDLPETIEWNGKFVRYKFNAQKFEIQK
jgi:hypothetical protein